jgi:NADPH:quinone reductase-like Zn-dependent oxidoreductase
MIKGSVAPARMVWLLSNMNPPATMKAVQLSRFGAPDVFEMIELPIPIPAPGEIQIRIRAAGINFFETLVRQNRYAVTPKLPIVPGVEVAGVVEALGEGVDPDLIGKPVAVPLFAVGRPTGGYAYQNQGWIDQLKDATGGKGVDIIYDTVGGPITGASLNALAPLGELVFAALNRCQLAARDLETMFNQNQSIKGFALLPLLDAVTLHDQLSGLFDLAQAATLKVLIGGSYPLDQVAEAHRALENRLTTGKVVLVP